MTEIIEHKGIIKGKPRQSEGREREIAKHLTSLEVDAAVLGSLHNEASIPLTDLLTHQEKVAKALQTLPLMGKWILLQPVDEEQGNEEVVLTSFRIPSSFEPFALDRENNEVSVSEFCAKVAGGWAVSLIDKPPQEASD